MIAVPTSTPDTDDQSGLAGVGFLFAASIVAKGVGAVKTVLFAWLLGPAEFGAFRIAITVQAILAGVCGLGLHTALLRYLPELQSGARTTFARRITMLAVLAALAGALVGILFVGQLSGAVFNESGRRGLMIAVLASVPFAVLFKCLVGTARGRGEFSRSALAESIQSILSLAIVGVLFFALPASASVAVAGLLLSFVASTAFVSRSLTGTSGSLLPQGIVKRAVAFSAWYALIPMMQYFFDLIDRWALARYVGLEAAGVYGLVPAITGGMALLSLSLAPVVVQRGAALMGRGEEAEAYRSVWGAVSLVLLVSLIVATALRCAGPIIWKVAGTKWESGASIFPSFLVYSMMYNVYWVLGSIAALREASWVALVSLVAGAITNLALNILWVPSYGMMGAAYATLIALTATTATHVIYMKVVGVTVPLRFWIAFALCFAGFLPAWGVAAIAIIAVLLAAKTDLLLDAHDRVLVRDFHARARARFGGAS